MDLWRQIRRPGSACLTVEEEYGGTPMGYLAHIVAMEEKSPALRLNRPVLRRAFQSVRQPDSPQRPRRAEAQIPAQTFIGEHVGALAMSEPGRFRRDGAEAAGRAQGDRYVLNGTKMWITNGPDANVGGLRPDRSDRRSQRRHRLPDRKRLSGLLDLAEAGQAGDARLAHRRAWYSRIAKCRQKT